MKNLPASPDLTHLKKQAKHLLRDARAGDTSALARFVETLPAARNIDPATHELRLHDAQSVIAREYGFTTWTELKRYVEWMASDAAARTRLWLNWCFEGMARDRKMALRMIDEQPELFARDPWFACLIGDDARLGETLARNPDFAKEPGGPLAMLPLVAVTHSKLIMEGREAGFLACATLLIQHGADANATWTDPRWPDFPLSALYGAAGRSHNVALTRLLLDAGASPNDNESLYHSVETADPACTRLLLDAGARVSGTNALGRVLDFDRLDTLKLLLARGEDVNEKAWLHHALLRGRSLDHVKALLDAGADPRAANDHGISLYRFAAQLGRTDVTGLLQSLGIEESLGEEEAFVAACTRSDEAAARAILVRQPDIFSRLTERQLQALPELASIGRIDAVRTMLALGWPREVKAEWDATALNLAVFQGDAAMTKLLMEAGADWQTKHGFDHNVIGTLAHASQADDIADPAPRDYVGCARALIEGGVPRNAFDVLSYSSDVSDYLDSLQ